MNHELDNNANSLTRLCIPLLPWDSEECTLKNPNANYLWLHSTRFLLWKKKKIASKIPERDRNAYQISKHDTQKRNGPESNIHFSILFFLNNWVWSKIFASLCVHSLQSHSGAVLGLLGTLKRFTYSCKHPTTQCLIHCNNFPSSHKFWGTPHYSNNNLQQKTKSSSGLKL